MLRTSPSSSRRAASGSAGNALASAAASTLPISSTMCSAQAVRSPSLPPK